MKIFKKTSAQKISWVKSNKALLEKQEHAIENLYYPESTLEFIELVCSFYRSQEIFDIVGHSSNTLFLPTYKVRHLICTKYLNKWKEENDCIVCDSGVSISRLSREMVKNGYVGFEGLTDLPGTIAASIYGNCGCRGCSVLDLMKNFELIDPNGNIHILTVEDLKPQYRTTSLKRGELRGVITCVRLKKTVGDAKLLSSIAEYNHKIRLEQQPSAANNLGTTYIGFNTTIKGKLFFMMEKIIKTLRNEKDSRITYPIVLRLFLKKKFIPYVYYWNRYMFMDEKSHVLFPQYTEFLKTLYSDLHFEIEIKK